MSFNTLLSFKSHQIRLCGTIIPQAVSPLVAQWYKTELEIDPPEAKEGPLTDISLMNSRLIFYQQLGITKQEFAEVISRTPQLMHLDHSDSARRTLIYLLKQGLSSYHLSNLLTKLPSVLELSLEAQVKPRLAYYREELLLNPEQMLKLFEECPEFLQFSIMKDIRLRIQYFARMGLTPEEVRKDVVLACPIVLGTRFHGEIKPKLDYFRTAASTACLKTAIVKFPHLMLLPLESHLRPFVDYFQDELGMGRRLFIQMVETCPHVLSVDVSREIKPKIDFFRSLDFDQMQIFGMIVRRPQLLMASLNDCLRKKIDDMTNSGVPRSLVTSMFLTTPRFFA